MNVDKRYAAVGRARGRLPQGRDRLPIYLICGRNTAWNTSKFAPCYSRARLAVTNRRYELWATGQPPVAQFVLPSWVSSLNHIAPIAILDLFELFLIPEHRSKAASFVFWAVNFDENIVELIRR
jgi:hypothetical protein